MATTTFEDTFLKELDGFLKEFKDHLAINVRNGASPDCWKDIRDMLLIDYPRLRDCYSAHGIENAYPKDEQSEKARLGRQLAGAMAHIWKDMYDVKPIAAKKNGKCAESINKYRHITDKERNLNADKLAEYAVQARNWIAKTPITKTNDKPKQHISQHPMLTDLAEVKPGEQISFIYKSRELAREDQAKIAYFVKALGWYNGIQDRRRPYSTSVTTHDTKEYVAWKLTIKRLDTSRPLPVVRQRG